MKNSFLLIFCAIVLLATSCQRKQMAYFQKSSSEQITHAKKSQPAVAAQETQAVETTQEEVVLPTAPIEASASVAEKIVVTENVATAPATTTMMPANDTKKVAKWKQKMIVKQLEKMSEKIAAKTLKSNANYNKIGKIAGILGIAGLVLLFVPSIGFLGILAGLTAFIMGLVAIKKADQKGWAIAGIVAGSLILLLLILAVTLLATLFSSFSL
ncbi:MAG: hypothetical protein MUF45_05455 [Spirosomaceae bacterium]|jgi:hypothetical protein|nr:hypothetical protein [Spirosomataceae bacterium]